MTKLAERHCVPCSGNVPELEREEIQRLLAELGGEWSVVDGHHLESHFLFPDFQTALDFTNLVGEEAEIQGHHPELVLVWGRVTVRIWTHAIDGLTESDFILAAKIQRVYG
jgi:4a-hydroxytetrahydrobiopterin dehydratase